MGNNAKIKVSILMLTYNQEHYINEAIRSVMLQETNFLFELVIGNDASTDGTGKICKEWQDKYPGQIILLDRKQNLGLQQNFIQTYAHCRGQYVAICEGDDFWTDKRKLQLQTDFMDAHPDYSTCFHRVINYYEDRGTKSLSNGGQKSESNILDLARSNYISNVSALFRRGLFGELPEWFPRQHLRLCHAPAERTIWKDTLYESSDGSLSPTWECYLERSWYGQEVGYSTRHPRIIDGVFQRKAPRRVRLPSTGTCTNLPEPDSLLQKDGTN